jgi:uncharacterized membrane protein YciS (DUF1049 family)
MATISDTLMTVASMPAIAGALSLLIGVALLFYSAIEWAITKKLAAKIAQMHAVPPEQARALTTLPLASLVTAVLAGIGVNVMTANRGNDQTQLGAQVTMIALIVSLSFGIFSVNKLTRPPARTRWLRLRLSRITLAVNDPLASSERLVLLRPEIVRYQHLGERLISMSKSTSFIGWIKRYTGTDALEFLIVFAYFPIAYTLAFQLFRVVTDQTSFTRTAKLAFTLVATIGIIGHIVGPILRWQSYKIRVATTGGDVERQARRLIRELDRMNRAIAEAHKAPAIISTPQPPSLLQRIFGSSRAEKVARRRSP